MTVPCMCWCLLTACDRAPKEVEEPTVMDRLDWCSPFVSLDEKEYLSFSIGDNAVSREPVKADKAAPPIWGKWTIDASVPTRINVSIGGDTTTYGMVAVGPTCLLISGTLESANMKQSWFGEEVFDEE